MNADIAYAVIEQIIDKLEQIEDRRADDAIDKLKEILEWLEKI